MFFKKTKKFAVSFLLTLFVFSSFTQFILVAQPAQAQLGVAILADAGRQISEIKDLIKESWKVAVMNAAQQAVGYFMRKVAYDSAVWLASGGKGQTPFAHTNSVGSYLKNVGDEAAGAAIDNLGSSFGLDLCKIPDVKIDLALRIGLHYNYGAEPPKPKCNLTTFTQNWSNSFSSVYNGDVDVGKMFAGSLRVDDTDLGINIKLSEKIDRLYLQQTEDARATRAEGGGFKAVTGLIDNRIKTPAAVTADEMRANAPNKQNDKSQAQIGAAMGSGAYQIIPSTLSIFLNTLSNQMLKNFRENGMLPFGAGCVSIDGVTGGKCPQPNVNNPNSSGTELTGRAAAEAVFGEFLTAKLDTVDNYDILAQLNSCDSHGLYNCRADQSLVQAIQEARHGEPVTIAQAIQKGWLHGSGKLIPPSSVTNNTDPRCFEKNNYCYSNVAVLRQLGIFPLGLEIAAKNSDPDQPATLEEVVKRFYDCNYQKDTQGNVVEVNYDPVNYPYCHLVDPNWVIKLEQTRCDALGYGPVPAGSDVPDRLQECMDIKTCVGRDSNGNCIGYGNCVREKNVWKFDADKCSPQFASCQVFTNTQGKQVSYLYRTLDTGSCDQSSVGCTSYSLSQNASGAWVAPSSLSATSADLSNKGVFLNNKVSTCNASAAGCSAFKLAQSANLFYLKKAPDYLNCYDKDANATNGVNWPQTMSDLTKMSPKAECSNFAQVCIASEVGCALFKDLSDPDAPSIPGKFTPAEVANNTVTAWNDQCDARCVGYSAYQELPTPYSAGNPTAYIIPPSKYNNNQSGLECSAQDDGCASFTNMESTANGGEKVESFTLLRQCIKPDAGKQKNFYTYEGSKIGGYQLQSYTLQLNPADGSPLTVFKNPAEANYANQYKCNENLYKDKLADPDCRQFNDNEGKVYYALLPNTVVVSADCTQYRLNSQELAGANQCFGNGQFKDGACYYFGLPGGIDSNGGSSKTCSAQAVSCRAYKGNHGNNIRTIALNAFEANPILTFETDISASGQNGWTVSGFNADALISNESTKAGEHSLEFNGSNGDVLSKTFAISGEDVDKASQQSYQVTFWAKGSGLNVQLGMTDGANQSSVGGIFSANTSWQVFKFNVKLPSVANSSTGQLTFKLQGSGSVFLDNIHLTKVSDYIYLVKDSLKVDPVCDDEPLDNLPGSALDCTAYNGPKNSLGDTLYYLTNFSYLCRDGAIGCTAFKDTFNKVGDTGPRAYNVFVPLPPGTISGVKLTAKIGSDEYSCQTEQGKTGCNINVKGHTLAEITTGSVNNNTTFPPRIVTSTYFVPADSADTNLVYLVADGSGNSSCNAVDMGCTAAGKQTVTPAGISYVTTTIKLDPNQFEGGNDANGNPQSGILCQAESVGCDEYSSSKGSAYFKDPAMAGNKVCSFQSFVDPSTSQNVSGWFWKDVSVCVNSSTKQIVNPSSPTYCSSNNDCSTGNICSEDLKNKQACYPDYKKNGNYYDLYSYGNTNQYKNFVGECPASQNTCTEFVDHADNDQTYYMLDNGKLSEGDCNGQVGQKAGCALFDQTDNPNKRFNTAATYAQSDNALNSNQKDIFNLTKVTPVSLGANNDANRIISVSRDRECAEWLQCKSATVRWDSQQNKYVSKCSALGLCNQLPSSVDPNGQSANCSEFITGQSEYSNKVLTESLYVTRDVSWKGRDLVGLSILNMYPIEELWQFDIAGANSSVPDYRLLKLIPCGTGNNCAAAASGIYSCKSATTQGVCGAQNDGVCVNGLCMKDSSGNGGSVQDLANNSLNQGCRVYPEKDSPFPNVFSLNNQNFAGVNKCFENEGKISGNNNALGFACECDYTKATFGNKATVKYFSQEKDSYLKEFNSTKGICVGGGKNGEICNYAIDANNMVVAGECEKAGGVCQVKDKQTNDFYGWKGFCLEYDQSRIIGGTQDNPEHPCLTWLPVDLVAGAVDVNNNHPESAAQLPEGTKYCLASDLYSTNMVGFDKCFNTPASFYNSDSNCQAYLSGNQDLICGSDFKPQGNSLSGVKGCDDYFPDWCHVRCVPKDPEKYSAGKWYSKIVSNFQDRQVGCQAYVEMDSLEAGLSPWSDRLWEYNKNLFKIDVSALASGDQNRLNFGLKSTSSPFAFLGDDLAKSANSELLLLRSCLVSGGIFDQPLSTSLCSSGSLKPYNGAPSNNLAYDRWNFASFSSCSNDGSCNVNTVCLNHTSQSSCQFKCKKDDGTGDDAKCKANFGPSSVCDVESNSCTSTSTPNKLLDCNFNGTSSNCEINGFACTGNCSFNGTVSSTLSCTGNNGCYQNICMGEDVKLCVGKNDIGKAPSNDKTLLTKIKESLSRLVQIYAKIPLENIKIFSNDQQKYVSQGVAGIESIAGLTNSDIDITGKLQTNYGGDQHTPYISAPKVRPVGVCDTKGQCEEINTDGFNINGKFPANTNDHVIIDTKPFEARFSFFYQVDSDHMPAKRIIVNPGTGRPDEIQKLDGNFWNQRGYTGDDSAFSTGGKCQQGHCTNIDGFASDTICNSDNDCKDVMVPTCVAEEKAPAFGYILNKTCEQKPFTTRFYYSCQGQGDPNWNPTCNVLTGAQKDKWNATYGQGSGCCVYQPTVQVLDNWGWCNGTCPDDQTGANDGTNGCYNGKKGTGNAGTVNECDSPFIMLNVTGDHSNTVFKSNVVVPANKVQNP